ncbi:MAG: FlgD immunoglobulin-like domain containing protein [bacterium]
MNLQKWDSVKFDFAVKAIIEQNKPTAVRDNKVLPNNPVYFIQNFPNPFNQETVIKLKIPKLAAVSLNIFDISGKLIRRIAQNELIDGEGLFPWDGKDADGFLVSSGIYFYIAKVGNDEVMTNKMLIIK